MTPDPLTAPLDYYENAEGWKASATATLPDLIEAIKGGDFAERVAEVRAHMANGDKPSADAIKKTLPAVSLSGVVVGRRKAAVAEGRFQHSGMLQIDLDAKDNPGWSVAEMREVLLADPHIIAGFVTPSGEGVKGVARITADATTHKAAFLAAEAHFSALNLTIDKSCKDPVRLCFVSHDPDAWIRGVGSADIIEFEPLPEPEEIELELPEENHRHNGNAVPVCAQHHVTDDGRLVIRGGDSFPELDAATVAEMLRCIPYPGYQEWLKITNAVWSVLGEAGTPILQAWAPEKKPGDYAEKWAHRLTDVTAATLVMRAKENGWKPKGELKVAMQEKALASKMAATIETPPEVEETGSTMQKFAPGDIFYEAPSGKYLVKVGKSFFTYSKKSPINTGVTRWLAPKYPKPAELQAAAFGAVSSRELDGAVMWAGNIAGHKQGVHRDANDLPILITSEAKPPKPADGESPIINDLLQQAFPDTTALQVFCAWLSGRYRAVRSHVHIPSPMLVLAGEVNSGKSLLAWIVGQLLGGRTANPYTAWSGGILWNDDLVGSELLLVDDCIGSTDIRMRRNFGAAFKEAIYPHAVQLRKRNVSAITVRPVWCVLVCCNDTPEALQIIPPLDADLSDKVALLHVAPMTLPIDTSTPLGVCALQSALRDELPAFGRQLLENETPEELRDSRSGVRAWRDPELAESVEAHSPAKRIETILEAAIQNRGIWHDLPREFTSSEIESRLLEHGSTVIHQARTLFTWHGACGSALAKLIKMGSHVVVEGGFDRTSKKPFYYLKG